MERISVQIQGWRPKEKGLRRAFSRSFALERNFTHAWGGTLAQAVFWGAQAPKCTPGAPGCCFLLGHNPRFGGHIFRLGAQAVIWGGTLPKCPPVVLGLLLVQPS